MPKRGKIIVIDGADGTGKATQTTLLLRRLKKERIRAKTFDFPQYQNNFFGKFIGECQVGKHGDFIHLSPYIASILYDCDRWETREKMEQALKRGYTLVLDRYVSANRIHQGGKIANKKREKFLRWLQELDFEVFRLPRPDLTLYLDVPFAKSQKLLIERKHTVSRGYLGNKKLDRAEKSKSHQLASRRHARDLVSRNGLVAIECIDGQGELLSPEVIHERIWKKARRILK